MLGAIAPLLRRLTGGAHPRVLFIDDWLPDPCIGAGAPRALVVMRAVMAAGSRLTLLPTAADPEDEGAARRLLPGAEVVLGYGRAGIGRLLAERIGSFDLIVVSRPHNMAAFRTAMEGLPAFGGVPVIYDAEAVFAMRESLRRTVLGQPNSAEQVTREVGQEIALCAGTRMILAVSENTAQAFSAGGHADVRVLGYAVWPQPTRTPFDQRDGFLFVGPTYEDSAPNSDSVVRFIDHMLPAIRRSMARDVPFVLAGIQQSPRVAARANGHLRMLGAVPDLTDVYSRARVFVAPTRFAAGIPVKVYDAAAYGVPVVLTPLLAEQIGWKHEDEALVAESSEDFVAQCLRLHGDQALWQSIRSRALRRVAQDCDPSRFNRVVAAVLKAARGQEH